jgi:transcriptional regulator with XRE-family HTH domain
MNERIRELRKTLKYTQEEFAKAIRVSRSNLGNLENGLINVTDRVVSDICTAFNVREDWLRTGAGEIFNEDKDMELAFLIGKLAAEPENKRNDFKKKFITFMLNQPDKSWDYFEDMFIAFNNYLNKK